MESVRGLEGGGGGGEGEDVSGSNQRNRMGNIFNDHRDARTVQELISEHFSMRGGILLLFSKVGIGLPAMAQSARFDSGIMLTPNSKTSVA